MIWLRVKELFMSFIVWFFVFPFVVWACFLYLVHEDFEVDVN